jgi:RNA-directed DNA polymerase
MEPKLNQFSEKFANLQTEDDLVNILNEASEELYGSTAYKFTLSQIRFHSNSNLNPKRYKVFHIAKKSGGMRQIHSPNNTLKEILTSLNLIFRELYSPHRNAFGFVAHKSIVDNAKKHVNRNYVFNADLKDFFPSIDQARVWERLKYPPFNLSDEKLKIRNLIAGLVCHTMEVERLVDGQWVKETKNVLPQGAPTSPIITNLICERLDRKLSGIAKKYGIQYSRYADDITFSSDHNVYQANGDFIKDFEEAVRSQNFHIKTSKTRLQKRGYRQEVTGIVVNESTNVKRDYIKTIRLWLYRWEKLGYDEAYKLFLDQYLKDKGHIKSNIPNMANVISGKLLYLKMVVGNDNNMYTMLQGRYDKLIENFNESQKSKNIFDDIFGKWRINDIKKAFTNIILDLYSHGVRMAIDNFNKKNNVGILEKDLKEVMYYFVERLQNKTNNNVLRGFYIFEELFYPQQIKDIILKHGQVKTVKQESTEELSNNYEVIKLAIYILIISKEDLVLKLWEEGGKDVWENEGLIDKLVNTNVLEDNKRIIDFLIPNEWALKNLINKL